MIFIYIYCSLFTPFIFYDVIFVLYLINNNKLIDTDKFQFFFQMSRLSYFMKETKEFFFLSLLVFIFSLDEINNLIK